MALKDLLVVLEQDAKARAEAARETARSEADRIVTDAAAAAAMRREEFLALREAEYRAEADAGLAAVRREAMRETYTARAEFLDRVFDAVHVRLAEAVPPDTYDSALAQHLDEALAYLPDEPAIVRCPPILEERVRELTDTRSNVTVAVDAAAPLGISVDARDGSVTVNNTLAARVERLRPLLNMELLQRLGSGA